MMKCFLLLLCSASLAMGACKSHKNMTDKDSLLISMRTHGCRGYCPVYQLDFYQSGKLLYRGIRFVRDTGIITTGITPEELADLKKTVAEVNLWQYPERIESQVADAPGSVMTVYNGAQQHAVSGSIDRPQPILNLEKKMKDLAEGHGFAVKFGVDPGAPPPGYEVIVQLRDDVNAGNWIGAYEDLRLRLVRRLGAENKWIVAYDPGKCSDKKLLGLFKEDKAVVAAQPNQKTEERN
jgi:hypothetical protein